MPAATSQPACLLDNEHAFWRAGPGRLLAGVDEAGRGPLAGPVTAAAVTMPAELAEHEYAGALRGLTDSKQLSAARRAAFYACLRTQAGIGIGVGWADPAEIDELNILQATHLAMWRALQALPCLPDHALIDGLPVPGLPCPSTAIVQGDARSLLIAAASVVAKVLRDSHMDDLGRRYPVYGFERHRGYGTHEHVTALFRHGPCPEHRRSFRPVQDALQALPGLTASPPGG